MGDRTVASRQAALNRSVSGAARRYRPHREQVMSLLLGAVRRDDAVAILGAGNGNDLDVAALCNRAGSCTLVDIDRDALDGILGSSGEEPRNLHVDVRDVTGVAGMIDAWSTTDDRAIDMLVMALADGPSLPESSFDVVASCCMLSQLASQAIAPIGSTRHPRALEVALAVRDAHLVLVATMLRPGGRGLVLTDVASTDGDPAIGDAGDAELAALLERIEGGGRCFAGTAPTGIAFALREDPSLAPLVEDVAVHAPWRWQLLEDRAHLVAAVSFTRSGEPHHDTPDGVPAG
jgi:hypothetical protein